MSFNCKECGKEFKTEASLHRHIKMHDMNLADYYTKHFPRKNLFTGDLLPFKNKADYLAFGSFSKSKLKPNAKKAYLNILKWAKRNIKKPIVAIGGINNSNYKKLIKSGAKYIAISSYIWDNPKLKPEIAIRKFK